MSVETLKSTVRDMFKSLDLSSEDLNVWGFYYGSPVACFCVACGTCIHDNMFAECGPMMGKNSFLCKQHGALLFRTLSKLELLLPTDEAEDEIRKSMKTKSLFLRETEHECELRWTYIGSCTPAGLIQTLNILYRVCAYVARCATGRILTVVIL